MNKILMSIKPQWSAKIFNGEKTVEVRRTRPKLEPPFEVLVYETKGQFIKSVKGACTTYGYGRGKVIGSFVCDKITCCQAYYGSSGEGHLTNLFGTECKRACLSEQELFDYITGNGGKMGTGWLWHITEPKLFDKPRELCEFCVPCKEYDSDKPHCGECDYYKYSPNDSGDAQEECLCGGSKPLRRPPQSWCRVEDKKEVGKYGT